MIKKLYAYAPYCDTNCFVEFCVGNDIDSWLELKIQFGGDTRDLSKHNAKHIDTINRYLKEYDAKCKLTKTKNSYIVKFNNDDEYLRFVLRWTP